MLLCGINATRAACAPTARLLDSDSYLYSDPYKYLTVQPFSEVQFMSLEDSGRMVNGAPSERAGVVASFVMLCAAFLSAALLRGCSTRDLEPHGERLTEFPCCRRRLLHSQRQAGRPCRLGDCVHGACCAVAVLSIRVLPVLALLRCTSFSSCLDLSHQSLPRCCACSVTASYA